MKKEKISNCIIALVIYGWTVERVSLYDEEGVEGWIWKDGYGNEYCEIGSWDELPPWPKEADKVINKLLGKI